MFSEESTRAAFALIGFWIFSVRHERWSLYRYRVSSVNLIFCDTIDSFYLLPIKKAKPQDAALPIKCEFPF